MLLNVAMVL